MRSFCALFRVSPLLVHFLSYLKRSLAYTSTSACRLECLQSVDWRDSRIAVYPDRLHHDMMYCCVCREAVKPNYSSVFRLGNKCLTFVYVPKDPLHQVGYIAWFVYSTCTSTIPIPSWHPTSWASFQITPLSRNYILSIHLLGSIPISPLNSRRCWPFESMLSLSAGYVIPQFPPRILP